MPNALGMFDILGNVSEWCYDSYVQNRELKPTEVHSTPTFTPITNYAYRGSEFNSMARMVRSANRNFARSEPGAANRGLRIVHTILPVRSE
jgi:formylglycine-generating enzyme required for sulfatase activity